MSKKPHEQNLGAPLLEENLNPLAFNMSATHYYKCKQDFQSPDKFSSVPYFLLCRSIELSIKARHLQRDGQSKVKSDYRHNICKAYNHLKDNEKILIKEELDTLKIANAIYSKKGFEYFVPQDAMTAFSGYPDLDKLDNIAKKFLDSFSHT